MCCYFEIVYHLILFICTLNKKNIEILYQIEMTFKCFVAVEICVDSRGNKTPNTKMHFEIDFINRIDFLESNQCLKINISTANRKFQLIFLYFFYCGKLYIIFTQKKNNRYKM